VRYFAKHGFRFVTACDLTARAVELTRSSIEQLGLSARIDIGNAEELPYGDATFDHVNCQGVVHHTPDPRRAVTEFRRVLRPEGTLCMSVYHRNFILRHPILVRIVASLLTDRVGLKGRGRERLLASGDATEIVRTYDGIDNPIGQAYTRVELEALFSGLFAVREIGYFFFPARALPIRVPRPLHRWLNRRAGLMIIARATAL
jgi:SAM-dependent methyltransferase